MYQPHQNAPHPVNANRFSSAVQKWSVIGIVLALLLASGVARAGDADDSYLAIYGMIQQADSLNAHGQTSRAHTKYIEADRALFQFQRDNPTWSPQIISYRLKYLADKVAATAENAPATQTKTNAEQKTAAAAAKSPVKLLNAGSEPRKLLRLHPAVGDKQTVTMTMKMNMSMAVAGKQTPAMDLPAMLMKMDVKVKNVSTNGEITYEITFTDADVLADSNTVPAIATVLKSSLASVVGMSGTGRMSNCGIVQSMDAKLPADAAPQLRQMFDQMKESLANSTSPFPEEPVGPGAKWQYKSRLKSQGMSLDQTLTMELVSIEGDHVTLRNTLTQNAANQQIESPSMPGLKVNLVKLTGTGNGHSTLDLNHIMPMTANMDDQTETVMGMNMGQQKKTMDMKMKVNASLESR